MMTFSCGRRGSKRDLPQFYPAELQERGDLHRRKQSQHQRSEMESRHVSVTQTHSFNLCIYSRSVLYILSLCVYLANLWYCPLHVELMKGSNLLRLSAHPLAEGNNWRLARAPLLTLLAEMCACVTGQRFPVLKVKSTELTRSFTSCMSKHTHTIYISEFMKVTS